ncbi:GNAT family N-acetyltransferase [Enterovibrio sp. ZSDZ35]|uniref:GNAT family N-acetyltransferase n=1 Tax=Enterovibrio qingdaonensis TaxID=2899818 RepID=A0ABT5QQ82_9GAMM|nr:GNAT family N-acetyltransferase [Enterovibrio sp. ZSDZ35]MDD1783144.1 GNAT family N-acetyltransferase [Enterovibrio sp. ZSDZ35]
MEVIRLPPESVPNYSTEITALLRHVFANPDMQVICNEELATYVVIMDGGQLIACSSAHVREMEQANQTFLAGVIGSVAVHPEWRAKGLCKMLINELEEHLVMRGVDVSFLFAYKPEVYQSNGYLLLNAPIHHFDDISNTWKRFIYRGGMVKHLSTLTLDPETEIDFRGCVY